jgi:hypothetical protein
VAEVEVQQIAEHGDFRESPASLAIDLIMRQIEFLEARELVYRCGYFPDFVEGKVKFGQDSKLHQLLREEDYLVVA